MTEIEREIKELKELLGSLNRVLILVAVLALIFTCVNVTLFAINQDVSPWIAWLLDPMVSITLGAVLIFDGRLAKFTEIATRPSGAAAILRWFAGLATWTMNTWSSLWPQGGFGAPTHMNVAGFVLHSIPPLLLITLAEAATAYRKHTTKLIAALTQKLPGAATGRTQTATRSTASPRQATAATSASPPAASAATPANASPSQPLPAPAPASTGSPATTPPGSQPKTTSATPTATGSSEARDLDEVAEAFRKLEAELGKSPSDRALGEALGVSRSRAQQLRDAAIKAGHTDLAKPLRAA